MDWLERTVSNWYWIAGASAGAAFLLRWLTRCQHPNPHYVAAAVEQDAATGTSVVVQAAHYECYECGKSWVAETRDPAWAPTAIVQKFEGYDEDKAVRSARRASLAQDRRRVLAAERVRHMGSLAEAKAADRRRKRPANVVDLNTRKPA